MQNANIIIKYQWVIKVGGVQGFAINLIQEPVLFVVILPNQWACTAKTFYIEKKLLTSGILIGIIITLIEG